MRRTERGFTLIELLIVIAIMIVLASLILAGAKALGIGSKKAKTQTILAAVRKGIELTIANKGGSVSPVEHPFAKSLPTRFKFRGYRGRILDADLKPSVGTINDVDTGSEAFSHIEEWFLTSNQNQCLMGDDWMVDKTIPGFYGYKREYMTILGAEMNWVTKYRRLPRPVPVTQASKVTGPYTAAMYPDVNYVVTGSGVPGDSKKSLDYLFGSSNVLPELTSLKAVYAPPDVQLATPWDYWIKAPTGAAVASASITVPGSGVVVSEKKVGTTGQAAWRPGLIKDNDIGIGGNYWKNYRIGGLAIYDAWEREILYSISNSGAVRLVSAGEDGVFKLDPSTNWTIETGQDATDTPDPKDKDGARDNVKQETAE